MSGCTATTAWLNVGACGAPSESTVALRPTAHYEDVTHLTLAWVLREHKSSNGEELSDRPTENCRNDDIHRAIVGRRTVTARATIRRAKHAVDGNILNGLSQPGEFYSSPLDRLCRSSVDRGHNRFRFFPDACQIISKEEFSVKSTELRLAHSQAAAGLPISPAPIEIGVCARNLSTKRPALWPVLS